MMRPDLPSNAPAPPGDFTVFRNPHMPDLAAFALLREPTKPRAGVSVWALDVDGCQTRYLGWCWLDGGGSRALQRALDGDRHGVPVVGAAPALSKAA